MMFSEAELCAQMRRTFGTLKNNTCLCTPYYRALTTNNQFLVLFLRFMEHDVQQACQRFLSFCEYHSKLTDDKNQIPVHGVLHVLSLGIFEVPNARDLEGRQLLLYYPGRLHSCLFSQKEFLQMVFLVVLEILKDEETQRRGITVVNNMQDFHRRNVSVSYLQAAASVLQKALPVSIGFIIIVNEPWFFNIFYSIIQRFLSKRIQACIRFLSADTARLSEWLPESAVPRALGGTLEHDHNAWVQRLLELPPLLPATPSQLTWPGPWAAPTPRLMASACTQTDPSSPTISPPLPHTLSTRGGSEPRKAPASPDGPPASVLRPDSPPLCTLSRRPPPSVSTVSTVSCTPSSFSSSSAASSSGPASPLCQLSGQPPPSVSTVSTVSCTPSSASSSSAASSSGLASPLVMSGSLSAASSSGPPSPPPPLLTFATNTTARTATATATATNTTARTATATATATTARTATATATATAPSSSMAPPPASPEETTTELTATDPPAGSPSLALLSLACTGIELR